MKLNTTEEIYRYLEAMPRFQDTGLEGARFDLERFRTFCEAIGNPQDDFPSVHIAGSNGKGSTCQILGAIYHETGYKTGIYTSPHLVEYRERFQIDGSAIPDDDLYRFFREHGDEVENYHLSYFELSTAIAFWWFSRQDVDLAIIETGLGGRLDATNIIEPLISVITNISLDHTEILGDNIRDIAREKAGIIKYHTPVVVGNVNDEAREVIRKVAAGQWSTVYETEDLSPAWKDGICTITKEGEQIKFSTDLYNPVQAHNIAAAWQVVSVLQDRFEVPETEIREALRHVRSVFRLPGRFQKLHPRLDWYFDGAHNIDAVKALVATVEEIQPVNQSVLILSLMKDKINGSVMSEFQKFKKIYYYRVGSKRAADIGDIEKWLPEVEIIPYEKNQLISFLKELESELVIFAGSFYFYATVQEWLQTLHSDH